MNERLHCDVAVVGAGLSGLAAATVLDRAGVTCQVVDARPKVGGRVVSEPLGGGIANLGAEWIGWRHRRVRALAARLGLHLAPTGLLGAPVRWRTDAAEPVSRVPPLSARSKLAFMRALWRLRRLARGLPPDAPWRATGAERLDREPFGRWLGVQGIEEDGYAVMDAFVGDIVSRPISDLSLLHVAWWVRRNRGPVPAIRSAVTARISEGSEMLARGLAAPLAGRIALETPVTTVEQGRDAVVLRACDGRELRARRAILAIPAPRLGDISFDPPLGAANSRLSAELAIGPATKIVATVAGMDDDLPRAVIGGDVLTACWRYGSLLTGFSRPPHDELDDAALRRDLADAFGLSDADLDGARIKRWAGERRIAGCDVCYMPGQLSELGPLLRKGDGLLRFAGPERSSWPNNMEGALESGERAAAEAIRSLGQPRA